MGAVELHPWNATIDNVAQADRLVLDLDPAAALSGSLSSRQLWHCGTIGGERAEKLAQADRQGIHVMVPLEHSMAHDAARTMRAHSRKSRRMLTPISISYPPILPGDLDGYFSTICGTARQYGGWRVFAPGARGVPHCNTGDVEAGRRACPGRCRYDEKPFARTQVK